jgi:hypothetical protein
VTQHVTVLRIEALNEIDSPLQNVSLRTDSTEIAIGEPLPVGAYVESFDDGTVRWFDGSGKSLGVKRVSQVTRSLKDGTEAIEVGAANKGAMTLTVWRTSSVPAFTVRASGSGRDPAARRATAFVR